MASQSIKADRESGSVVNPRGGSRERLTDYVYNKELRTKRLKHGKSFRYVNQGGKAKDVGA